MSIPGFIEKYSDLKRGEQLKETEVALAGRIMVIRDNKKLKFYDLHGEVSHFSEIELMGRAQNFKSRHKFSFRNLKKHGQYMKFWVEAISLVSVASPVEQTPKAEKLRVKASSPSLPQKLFCSRHVCTAFLLPSTD